MTPQAIKTLCKGLAVIMVLVGGLGSIACLPMAFGPLFWAATTGVYFVAGAVLIGSGLVSFSFLMSKE